jgi:uncharacterized protein
MMLVDTNLLVYAHRSDVARHPEYRDWLQRVIDGPEPYAVSDFAVTGMIRIVTRDQIRHQGHAHISTPGPRCWEIFAGLCGQANVRGNLVPDVFLAALAIEHGCEFITANKDFRKFPGLRWRHPLN